jgi:hypothetical protein
MLNRKDRIREDKLLGVCEIVDMATEHTSWTTLIYSPSDAITMTDQLYR